MPKTHLNPKSLFPSVESGFSQLVETQGGRTVYISGQTAWNSQKEIVGGVSPGAQMRQALMNVQTAVETAGGALKDIVSLRIYVVDYKSSYASEISEALREFFPGASPPASTWIGVNALAVKDFLVEVEAVAVIE